MNIAETPAAIEAAKQVNTLTVALSEVTARIDSIQAIQRAHADEPRNRLTDALALASGKTVAPELPKEAGELMAKRAALAEGLELAQTAYRDAMASQSIAHNAAQAPRLIETYEAIASGLQATLDAFAGLEAIRTDAAAVGVDPAAGGYAVEVDYQMREPLERMAKTVRELAEATRDRFEPDGPAVRVAVLADVEGGKPGDHLTMPAKLARLLVRMGRVEMQTNAQRLKRVAA